MTLDITQNCPCGNAVPYHNCCGIYIENQEQPPTPELLMRSRYTAFVLEKEEYILQTWHARTRPKELNFADNPVVWLGLAVDPATPPDMNATEGVVSFTASYLENGQVCHLHETSNFLLEDGKWLYLKGDCTVAKTKVARNDLCPCGSGKKFKKCCLP